MPDHYHHPPIPLFLWLVVHAGVRPLVPLDQQREEDLLWIRDDFLNCEEDFGKLVVHGHEPVAQPDVRFNRINIDTGAFATGRLSCLIIEGTTIIPMTDKHDWVARIYETGISQSAEAGSDNVDASKAIGAKCIHAPITAAATGTRVGAGRDHDERGRTSAPIAKSPKQDRALRHDHAGRQLTLPVQRPSHRMPFVARHLAAAVTAAIVALRSISLRSRFARSPKAPRWPIGGSCTSMRLFEDRQALAYALVRDILHYSESIPTLSGQPCGRAQ
jgi:hypothetical protein